MSRYVVGKVDPVPEGFSTVTESELATLLAEAHAVIIKFEDLVDPDALLRRIAEHDVPAAVIFDRITPEILSDVILEYSAIVLPIDASSEESMSSAIRFDATREWSRPPEDAIEIGSLFPLTGREDPDGYSEAYEQQRTLSLVSERSTGFLQALRTAVSQMKRPVVDPLWNPWDEGESLARQSGTSWSLRVAPGIRPNLQDLFRVPDSDATHELLSEQPRDPEWLVHPPKLLITGASGTGKSLVARIVHRMLWREQKGLDPTSPFVSVNLGARQVDNLDHELYGAAAGYYTEAWGPGLLARAACGTVFFDEIGDLPLNAQARLLDYLDRLMVRPAGMRPFFGHSHVIAATNRDLDALIVGGRFRHDLRARFSLLIEIPPLRERGHLEIRRLVDFVAQNPTINPVAEDGTFTVTHISSEAMGLLQSHEYRDGNFRELEEAVRGAVGKAIARRSRVLETRDVTLTPARYRPDAARRVVAVRELELSRWGLVVLVDSSQELERLSEMVGAPVLVDRGGRRAVLTGNVAYVFEAARDS